MKYIFMCNQILMGKLCIIFKLNTINIRIDFYMDIAMIVGCRVEKLKD
jgi:hypothetical protein